MNSVTKRVSPQLFVHFDGTVTTVTKKLSGYLTREVFPQAKLRLFDTQSNGNSQLFVFAGLVV